MFFSQYPVLLWDLDGTLTDPADGIVHSVQYALRHYGMWAEREELLSFIGPPLADSFAEKFGFSPEQSREAVEIYREYFRKDGMYQNVPYDGIQELLEKLQAAGKKMYLASSKPEPLCEQILEHFGLRRYLDGVAGSDFAGTRARKDQVIQYLLDRENLSSQQVLMIGDRKYDVEGAAGFSIPCIGVLWGYGSREELKTAGAAAVAENIPQLERLLLDRPAN
jgi:phosphoglycolate phosphatase